MSEIAVYSEQEHFTGDDSIVDEMSLMLDVLNSAIVTGVMPAVGSPCQLKLIELMKLSGRKPTAGEK